MARKETTPTQYFEGPWRKEMTTTTRALNEPLPYSRMSQSDLFDSLYGRGNWLADETAHTDNQLGRIATRIEYNLADEALANHMRGEGYRLDDGTDVRNTVQRRAHTDIVDIVVSPDGDAYRAGLIELDKEIQNFADSIDPSQDL